MDAELVSAVAAVVVAAGSSWADTEAAVSWLAAYTATMQMSTELSMLDKVKPNVTPHSPHLRLGPLWGLERHWSMQGLP